MSFTARRCQTAQTGPEHVRQLHVCLWRTSLNVRPPSLSPSVHLNSVYGRYRGESIKRVSNSSRIITCPKRRSLNTEKRRAQTGLMDKFFNINLGVRLQDTSQTRKRAEERYLATSLDDEQATSPLKPATAGDEKF
ncbi:hypothetical protein EVAR_90546_1 [Eumeta japonica]|uniref:Uncharacterized protein n=1 Tax=Eumeta variegata TaxID=151549 RepID=A0A4C1XUQ1_EUMVA|nr:hypothetical protein EVAR_90546_1 [Eumeta japonica]